MKCHHRRRQSGDTIIEVMICITIAGSILAGAFVATNRSLRTTRQTQERMEATQLVQQQVEMLKGALVERSTAIPPTPQIPFCFSPDGTKTGLYTDAAALLPSLNLDPLNNYNAACQRNGLFNLSIVYDTTPASQQYVFRARWFGLGGSNKEEVIIRYRTN